VLPNLWQHHPAIQKHAKQIGRKGPDDRTLGQKAADVMRNTMGSWTFIFGFLGAMLVWAMVNTFLHIGQPPSIGGRKGFDPYPYILLNLILSTLAGLQAAALLIAAKRSDHIASVISLHTEQNTDELKEGLQQNTEITQAVHVNTKLIHLLALKAGVTEDEIKSALDEANSELCK
jgi:uncharacterized membrane protein